VLGVSRTVTEVELKSAYRKLAMQWHPDRNPNNPDAEDKFKEVTEAYAILADSEKRSLYDRYGHAGVGSAAGQGVGFDGTAFQDLGEIFGEFLASGTRLGPEDASAAVYSAAPICAKTSPLNLKKLYSAPRLA
jgi:molecular chaperone DnaJ